MLLSNTKFTIAWDIKTTKEIKVKLYNTINIMLGNFDINVYAYKT